MSVAIMCDCHDFGFTQAFDFILQVSKSCDNGGPVDVRYCGTHFGHDLDEAKLPFSQQEIELMKDMLMKHRLDIVAALKDLRGMLLYLLNTGVIDWNHECREIIEKCNAPNIFVFYRNVVSQSWERVLCAQTGFVRSDYCARHGPKSQGRE